MSTSSPTNRGPERLIRLLLAGAMVVVTLGVANLWVWHGELNAARDEQQVRVLVHRIDDVLQREADSLALLAGFHAEVSPITETQYRGVASKVLLERQGVQALEWVRRFSQAEADAAGIFLREEGGGDPVPAKGRPDYYPVWYVYPEEGNEAAERFDLGSDPDRRAAIEAAERTGLAVATAPLVLVQDAEPSPSFLWFQPLPPRDDGEVPGFALGVYRVQDLLQHGMGHLLDDDTYVEVRDGQTEELLFATGPGDGASLHERSVAFGQRSWRVTIGLHPRGRGFANLGIFVMWLGGMGLIGLSWRVWAGQEAHREEIEHRVEARTTQLKRMAESLAEARDEAQRANDAKTEFLAVMSHELRTPVHGQLGMMRLLRHDRLTVEQKRLLEASIRSGEALLGLLNDLLDVAKLNAKAMGLDEVVFAPREVLQDVEDLSSGFVTEKEVVFDLVVDEMLPQLLKGDASKLKQVLVNLTSNAAKFTSKGHVRLSVTVEEATPERVSLTFRCADTGVGIPAAALPALFDPFTQADASISRQFGGTGLGLNIVRSMTELMGGSIEVESEEGVGTTFTVHLCFQRATELESTPALAVREFLPMRSCRVLVVDDNPVNRLVACKMLDVLGHEAEEATDGKDALNKLGAAHFDVVLMDVHMPVVNGVAATQELRATDGPNREVPVVALTADAVTTNKDLCREVGMDGFLSKPFSTEDLDLAIREALQRTQ